MQKPPWPLRVRGSWDILTRTHPCEGSQTTNTNSAFKVEICLVLDDLMRFVGVVAGDGGTYSSGSVPAVREDRRQPAAYSAPPARQQPPPAEEEEEANDYDSDEASEYTICLLLFMKWLMCVV